MSNLAHAQWWERLTAASYCIHIAPMLKGSRQDGAPTLNF